ILALTAMATFSPLAWPHPITLLSSPLAKISFLQADEQVVEHLPWKFRCIFIGSIDNNQMIMELRKDGDMLEGSYYYQQIGATLSLQGEIGLDGNVTLRECDRYGRDTGLFKGILRMQVINRDQLMVLDGDWIRS